MKQGTLRAGMADDAEPLSISDTSMILKYSYCLMASAGVHV
jgi:hypothetical protein